MGTKLKAGLFVIVLVMGAIAAYNFSSSSGAGKVMDGVGNVVATVGESAVNVGNGIGITTPKDKKETKNVSEDCTSNAECKNGACGRLNAGSGSLICCPSGSISTYGGYGYCTQIPDGSPCWSDVMCQNGYCKGNGGGIRKGVCRSKSQVNERCDSNSDCANNACARATAKEGEILTCCASAETHLYAGYHYCKKMRDGSACWSDAMCNSGYCSGNQGGLRRGTCKSKAAVGEACSGNSDCANGACARATARDGTELTCCASGKTHLYAGYDYCKGMPNGSSCWSDAMCASDNCKGNMSGLRRGTCR